MEKAQIIALLEEWGRSGFDPDGLRRIREWARDQKEESLREVMEDYAPILLKQTSFPEPDAELLTHIRTRIAEREAEEQAPVRRLPGIFRLTAAAVIVLLLGTGAWWLFHKQPATSPVAQTTQPGDVPAPATTHATLTLSNGQHVALDSAGTGTLAQQGNASVIIDDAGKLSYKVENITNKELLYNTLTNPRGSPVIHLTLQDGTKVWLNAESSIRYPVVFTGNDRLVEVTGEAYFEVADNPNKPFRVRQGNTLVDVLGTSFNINAYPDEPATKVTLLDGKVKVSKEAANVILNPGQQAVVTRQVERTGPVDTAAVMSWKNGRFTFRSADLATVLRQLSRWYNVDVSYEGKIPDQYFSGRIGRNLTLDQVLKVLTGTGVHYRIETGPANKLIIQP